MSSPSKSPTMEAVQQSHPQAKASVTQVTAYSTGFPNPIKQFQPAGKEADRQASLTRTPADAIIVSSVAAEADQFSDEEEELNHFNNNQKREHDAFLKSFPPGYRFNPRDDELVLYYLQKKIMEEPLPPNRIMEVNLYRHNPETLAERYENYGEKEWYFFTPRDRKYRNGFRPNRAAGDGYWKATGADKPIRSNGVAVPVGFRKALVFYRGKPPKGNKTNWIMHEYRVSDSPPPTKRTENDMRLDNWVLCRIYKKVDSKSSKSQNRNHEEDPSEEIISTSPPENTTPPENKETEMNNHFDNTQALESEKAYSCTTVHPPCESNRAYYNYAYPFRGGRPVCFNNNMLHQNRFQSAALNFGNIYPNMGQMQPVCGTPSLMHFSDTKCGVQLSDQKFTMQPFTLESITYHQCSDQRCAMQVPDRKCIFQPVDVADIGHPSIPSFSDQKSSHQELSKPPSLPSFSDQKSSHQELSKPPSLPSPDQGLQYVEESNDDLNLMFGYPQFVSFENFSWP